MGRVGDCDVNTVGFCEQQLIRACKIGQRQRCTQSKQRIAFRIQRAKRYGMDGRQWTAGPPFLDGARLGSTAKVVNMPIRPATKTKPEIASRICSKTEILCQICQRGSRDYCQQRSLVNSVIFRWRRKVLIRLFKPIIKAVIVSGSKFIVCFCLAVNCSGSWPSPLQST